MADPYNYGQGATVSAQGAVNNQNDNYADFMGKLPSYQAQLQNQAFDQGADSYNQQKKQIDKSANKRGLLFSGMKQGAESSAANQIANETQGKIAQNNKGLQDYANQYGSQVAQSNIANYQSNVSSAFNDYQNKLKEQQQQSGLMGSIGGGLGSIMGLFMNKGGRVPGKPKLDYDDPKNDNTLVVATPGEIVIPMTKAKSKEKSKEFIDSHFKKENKPDLLKSVASVSSVNSFLKKRRNKGGE